MPGLAIALHSALRPFIDRYALPLSLAAGASLALAFAPFGAWPLAVLCPAILFFLWQDAAPRRAAAIGFWFHAGTFTAGTYWLYHSIHVVGGAPIWIAVFLMLGLAAVMGGYLALLGYVQARWLPRAGARRWLMGLPAGWLLLEWFRGWFLSGFPWLSLGYSQIDSPLSGLAPVAGVYGVGLVAALTAGAWVALLLGSVRVRVAAVLAMALPWGVAASVWHRDWTQAFDGSIGVAIVQGAVPQDQKWSVEWRDKTLELYRRLTEPHFGADLIVWPEAALPDLSYQLTDYLSRLWRAARESGSDVLLGLLRYDPRADTYYNGVLALAEQPEWYHKRRLVPFGEFFPVPSFVRSWLRLMNLPYSDLTPGAANQPSLNAAGQKIGMTICYEDSYGAEQLAVLREATLLVNVTNDAWFGDTSAAYQHLEISRMRAREAGRPLLRAANDGVSAIIDAQGAVTATLPRFQAAVLTGVVQPRTGLTPYARAGNWPVIVLALTGIALAMAARQRQTNKGK